MSRRISTDTDTSADTSLDTYDRAADAAAATVIRRYSTSFGMATRMLGARTRGHVRNVYALVRLADEIVDGPAAQAGLDQGDIRRLLDALENETLATLDRGFSTNLVVHAFGRTATSCGIGADLIRPFFASMRTDIDTAAHDNASHAAYVYGSAEVVGLMCLHVFMNAGRAQPAPIDPALVTGAQRLGAAFQDLNFLRDHTSDRTTLGRDYLGLDAAEGTRAEGTRAEVLARIDADLQAAARVIPLLPHDCRRSVSAAHDLFAALADRLARHPDAHERIRVPDWSKAMIIACAARRAAPRRSGTVLS